MTTADPEAWQELRRRADELAVLNDLARRLAALRDPREVLSEVARQARRLLGVDVAYIMLLHDDLLRIDVVDGTIGSSMRGIELDRGSGLGGAILRTGQPLWSERYLDDQRFPHRRSVDAAAASEQLGGILGVPMIVGEETIGVLLAADRRPRTFADREVALLAALAAHAAVAIRNADLFDRQRAAAAELSEANEALRRSNDQRQRANDLRDSLNDAVIKGGGLSAVAAVLERVARVEIEIRDADDRTLIGVRRETPGAQVPVLLPSGSAGSVIARSDPPPDDEALRLLRIGATSVAIVTASQRSLTEAELRSRGEFMHALLASDAGEESLRRRGRAIGIDLDSVRTVAAFDAGTSDPTPVAQLVARLTGEIGGWSAVHAGLMVVLLPTATVESVRATITRTADGSPLPAAVGLSPCVGGSVGVRSAYESARQTTVVLAALGRTRECAAAAELGIYRSLFSQAGRGELAEFVRLTIGPLLDHDRRRQRDLAVTLQTYLEQAQHHARTCATLHVHPNTLYQRLDRINELLGDTWKDPSHTLEVQLALRLHRLLGAVEE